MIPLGDSLSILYADLRLKTGEKLAKSLKTVIIFGGASSEHDVSVVSAHQLMDAADMLPYDVVENLNGDCWVDIGAETFSPQEISAAILAKMKSTAEAWQKAPGYPTRVPLDWLSIAAALGDEWNFIFVLGYRPYLDWVRRSSQNASSDLNGG